MPDLKSLMHGWRSALARRFLVGLRRATHRMPVLLEAPVASRLLVIAPHMDDETIACGGTLLRHRALGSAVRVVFVSDSSAGLADAALAARVAAARRAEMALVTPAYGLESIVELGFPDGSLVGHEAPIAARLAAQIRAFAPAQIFVPFPFDGHADHQACALAAGEAMRQAGWAGEVMAYEVWSALWPNLAIDIGAVADAKAALIRGYASQMADRDYATATLGLNRYRGLAHRIEYAEAFHRCTPAQFRALTACLDTLG
jgi:N-acetylglucosamine malate deacetylase 1